MTSETTRVIQTSLLFTVIVTIAIHVSRSNQRIHFRDHWNVAIEGNTWCVQAERDTVPSLLASIFVSIDNREVILCIVDPLQAGIQEVSKKEMASRYRTYL
jgi:hypothetical protein